MKKISLRSTSLGTQVAVAVTLMACSFSNAHSQALSTDVENQNRGLSGPGIRSKSTPEVLQIDKRTDDSPSPSANDAATFPVARFKIDGLTALSADDVLARVSKKISLTEGTYTLKRVNEIAGEVQSVLRGEGLIGAIAIVPAQKLTDGTLSIQVIEAKLSSSHYSEITNDPDKTIFPPYRVAMPVVETVVKRELCLDAERFDCTPGALRQADVERALLLAGEMTNSTVKGNLGLDAANGLGLDVSSQALPRVSGELGVDNSGTPSTGTYRAQGRVAIRDLFSPGDVLAMNAMRSTTGETTDLGINYSRFIGHAGWKVGVAAGKTQYQLGGDFASLDGSGNAKTLSVYASYPLLRRLRAYSDFRVEYQHAALSDSLIGEDTKRTYKQIRAGGSGAFADNFFALNASSAWSLMLAAANVSSTEAADAAYQVDSSSLKLIGSFNRVQFLGNGFQASVNIYGQASNANLPGYGKLYLGGPGAVRAYIAGEAGGDSAVIAQTQLGWIGSIPYLDNPDWKWGAGVFYDRGWAKLQQHPTITASENTVVLAGAGVEFSLLRQDRFSLRVFYARPVGSRASSVDGKEDRIGFSVGVAF